jgi:pyruvate/2-oxoglutarate dehydrogenase complex dihydrolipoamide dehydrogenase (E3) component
LVTAERRPNAAALELAQAGVRCNDGAVAVDETLQTQNPHVFAAGDVIGRRCLVHTAAAAGRIAASNALSGERKSIDFDRLEAHGVYTQPQLAVAGLTEALCRERGLDVLVAREHFADVGKSIVSAEPEGFLKMLTTRDGRVVGVGIVGANAIDLIAEAMVWLDRRATATVIASLQHLHPTASEIYGRVAERVSRLQ